MTRDEIIRMADEAKLIAVMEMFEDEVVRFATLVAEHEREHGMKLLTDVLIDAAVKAEREACAKACDDLERKKWETLTKGGELSGFGAKDCAAAIRARK